MEPSSKGPNESGEWEHVRDSWVAPEPAPPFAPAVPSPAAHATEDAAADAPAERRPASSPPPLAPAALADRMLARLAADDFEGALLSAQALLGLVPRHPDALQCAEMARRHLTRVYAERLGYPESAALRVARNAGVDASDLDARARRVLSLADGVTTVDAVLATDLVDPFDALRILSELVLRGVVGLRAE